MEWVLEFLLGLIVMVALQTFGGLLTFYCTRSKMAQSQKIFVTLSCLFLIAALSQPVFNPNTHLIGRVIASCCLCFTIPLNAIACIERSSLGKETMSAKETILRVSVPIAIESKRNPVEKPAVHFFRGVAYILLGMFCAPYFESFLEKGGIPLDVLALAFVLSGANGSLNFMAAFMGLLGIHSPAPFRRPLLSPTMGAFWGGRWNAPVSDALRLGVYEPLKRRGFSAGVSAMFCFFWSGVAHEVLLLYCNAKGSRGEWFWFFVLSGLATMIEKMTFSYIPKTGFRRWLLSFVVLYPLFHFLFIPVTIRTGLAASGVDAMGAGRIVYAHLRERFESRA